MTVLVCTGTLTGTTTPQFSSLDEFVAAVRVTDIFANSETEACHGLAKGVDAEFHQICRKYHVSLRGHPGNILSKRAEISVSDFAVMFPVKNSIWRNHDMIDYAVTVKDRLLVACPKEDHEVIRSGTWATVRYARSCGIDIVYIWPSDGAVELRRPGSPHYYSKGRHV